MSRVVYPILYDLRVPRGYICAGDMHGVITILSPDRPTIESFAQTPTMSQLLYFLHSMSHPRS